VLNIKRLFCKKQDPNATLCKYYSTCKSCSNAHRILLKTVNNKGHLVFLFTYDFFKSRVPLLTSNCENVGKLKLKSPSPRNGQRQNRLPWRFPLYCEHKKLKLGPLKSSCYFFFFFQIFHQKQTPVLIFKVSPVMFCVMTRHKPIFTELYGSFYTIKLCIAISRALFINKLFHLGWSATKKKVRMFTFSRRKQKQISALRTCNVQCINLGIHNWKLTSLPSGWDVLTLHNCSTVVSVSSLRKHCEFWYVRDKPID